MASLQVLTEKKKYEINWRHDDCCLLKLSKKITLKKLIKNKRIEINHWEMTKHKIFLCFLSKQQKNDKEKNRKQANCILNSIEINLQIWCGNYVDIFDLRLFGVDTGVINCYIIKNRVLSIYIKSLKGKFCITCCVVHINSIKIDVFREFSLFYHVWCRQWHCIIIKVRWQKTNNHITKLIADWESHLNRRLIDRNWWIPIKYRNDCIWINLLSIF